MPTLFVVAGPNGSGKSTLTRTTWFRGIQVIDPDAIARYSVPSTPRQAAREAVRQRSVAVAKGRTVVVESTLAGSTTLRLMKVARTVGYRVELHYVCVASPDQALDRIRTRVAMGGHDVPEADVRRRFARSLANLPAAFALADETRLYDNAGYEQPHREVAVLTANAWWIAEPLPGWAADVLAPMMPSRP